MRGDPQNHWISLLEIFEIVFIEIIIKKLEQGTS
jgi:hypothetical protein